MDPATVARHRLEAMEARTRSFCRAATPRRRPGPGGANRRQPTWPLAAREQPRAHHCLADRLLQLTRPPPRRRTAAGLIRRTAGYGPVCPVVWEGRSREAPPYPDCRIGSGTYLDGSRSCDVAIATRKMAACATCQAISGAS